MSIAFFELVIFFSSLYEISLGLHFFYYQLAFGPLRLMLFKKWGENRRALSYTLMKDTEPVAKPFPMLTSINGCLTSNASDIKKAGEVCLSVKTLEPVGEPPKGLNG